MLSRLWASITGADDGDVAQTEISAENARILDDVLKKLTDIDDVDAPFERQLIEEPEPEPEQVPEADPADYATLDIEDATPVPRPTPQATPSFALPPSPLSPPADPVEQEMGATETPKTVRAARNYEIEIADLEQRLRAQEAAAERVKTKLALRERHGALLRGRVQILEHELERWTKVERGMQSTQTDAPAIGTTEVQTVTVGVGCGTVATQTRIRRVPATLTAEPRERPKEGYASRVTPPQPVKVEAPTVRQEKEVTDTRPARAQKAKAEGRPAGKEGYSSRPASGERRAKPRPAKTATKPRAASAAPGPIRPAAAAAVRPVSKPRPARLTIDNPATQPNPSRNPAPRPRPAPRPHQLVRPMSPDDRPAEPVDIESRGPMRRRLRLEDLTHGAAETQ